MRCVLFLHRPLPVITRFVRAHCPKKRSSPLTRRFILAQPLNDFVVGRCLVSNTNASTSRHTSRHPFRHIVFVQPIRPRRSSTVNPNGFFVGVVPVPVFLFDPRFPEIPAACSWFRSGLLLLLLLLWLFQTSRPIS